jgi:hypothetical protein
MPIKFLFMVNKQGQTRIAKYYMDMTVLQRITLEGELIRKCLSRTPFQVSIENQPCLAFPISLSLKRGVSDSNLVFSAPF